MSIEKSQPILEQLAKEAIIYFDVLVIGGGATGIWAASRLAQRGLSIALIEAGGIAKMSSNSEARKADDLPYTFPKGRPFSWTRVRELGGRTNSWGRVSLRMSDLDFSAAERDGVGEPWPISYREISTHYDQVERALRVLGHKDRLPQIPDGHFTNYPESSVHLDFKRVVQNRYPERKVVSGRIATRNFPDLLLPGMQARKITVFIECTGVVVTQSPDGRMATGAIVVHNQTKKSCELKAKAVVLCASTIESTLIMLNSTSRHHPGGLGNSSEQLGRNLMEHTMVDCNGVIPHFGGTTITTEGMGMSLLPRFQNLASQDRSYFRGFGIQIHWEICQNILNKKEKCRFSLRSPQKHHYHFLMRSFGEVLSSEHNRVSLDPRKLDHFGFPLPHIDFRYHENEKRIQRDQRKVMTEIARSAGFQIIRRHIFAPGESIHELGTARMGHSPLNSVLNSCGQSWDVPNLYVMDGSCFVTSGFQNPTLTMLALCNRSCDHLIGSFKRNQF